jgi:hypothetical protein
MKFCKVGLFFVLLVAACLPAAAQQYVLRFEIPFDFVAAGRSLPAGHYEVKRVWTARDAAWAIVGDHGSMRFITNSVESPKVPHGPSLVFVKAGDQYSLLQIWDEEHFGRQLPRSKVKQTMVAQGSKYVEVGAE